MELDKKVKQNIRDKINNDIANEVKEATKDELEIIEDRNFANVVYNYVEGVIERYSKYMAIRVIDYLEREFIDYVEDKTIETMKYDLKSYFTKDIYRTKGRLYDSDEDMNEPIESKIHTLEYVIRYIDKYGECNPYEEW